MIKLWEFLNLQPRSEGAKVPGGDVSVLRGVLAVADLVVAGDAVHDGGQAQEAGGRRGLAGS